MRVLLVYPNCDREVMAWGDMGAIAEPLALEYVAAACEQAGHDAMILDLRLHPEQLELMLFAYQPDVVGVTGYSMHVIRNLEVLARVKEIRPTCHTMVGGHHATLLPIDFQGPQVDFVVVGEGLHPLRAILAAVAEGRRSPSVPSVWTRCGDEFRWGGEAEGFDIDDIPFPKRSLTSDDRHRYYIDWMRPIALLRTTVGCPFRCSFCALWKIMDGKYYRRELEPVVEEIGGVAERYVFLVDDEPFVNVPRMRHLADMIKAADLGKEYFAYCRIDSFLRDRNLMERWHEVGLRRVFFGIEAIDDVELDDYNKRQRREQITQALTAAREIGVSVLANFIVKPGYTADDFQRIVDFIDENGVEYPTFTILTPIPGTSFFDLQYDEILHRQANGRPNWAYFDLQHAVTKTALSPEAFLHEYRGLQRRFATSYLQAGHPMYEELQATGRMPGPGAVER
jgi:radical SAM superfamily enzyme YgiQ (UPF0313 family)